MLALAPAAVAARLLPAQVANPHQDAFPAPHVPGTQPDTTRLPNGKLQRDEILKADYEKNLKDARDLVDMSKAFELDLEKSDRFVLSVGLLKKLDDIEKISKRIRGRMKR
ncbi:MAG: hypothetical protein QOJ99_4191 [Bryobacterales bacterium]|nr:hypothetical protein [Bryobacterales bacterium]